MLQRLLTSALIAGAAAGLIAALLQLVFVQPVLLHAELYEGGERTHFAAPSEHHHGEEADAATPTAEPAHDHSTEAAHDHAEAADIPGIDFDAPRDGLSILFSIMVYAGYGLLLVAAIALSESNGNRVTARQGLLWGVAGFVAVQMAPAFGLSPELPGMAAADVNARAIWWVATVIATAIGLWLIAFGKNGVAWAAAVLLILAPHIIGAPHPHEFTGPTPPELAAQFAGRAIGVGLAVWVLLGLFVATLWSRGREA
ncbi:cobalt transporter [Xinfangfangia sp. D13-10-4-6]|uniref:CbtA family protein n=1 Tax=Pseudogemmobacter hezensis TaxID=2737662 RepID=UPI001552F103|nr:CbtA family protein [Pseudogemmobacter hezensis]NPD16570.1 cobalt transporter [Pseudogemmobacter hezensis]